MKAIIEAPEFVHRMFADWDIGEEGKQKVWQAFVEYMVGVNFPVHLQVCLDVFTDSIEESGQIDEILNCE